MKRATFAIRPLALMLAAVACNMPNPAFEGGTDGDEEGESTEPGDGDPGDGDDGDGDGDDGDGDTGDGDPGDGDGDGDPIDPECNQPSGGFMEFCTYPEPACPLGLICVVVNGQDNINGADGFCTLQCESVDDCIWGSEGQCGDPSMLCVQTVGGVEDPPPHVCVLPCEDIGECYPDQVCALDAGVCHPPN